MVTLLPKRRASVFVVMYPHLHVANHKVWKIINAFRQITHHIWHLPRTVLFWQYWRNHYRKWPIVFAIVMFTLCKWMFYHQTGL